MNDTDDLDAWLDANAALLGITIAPEWRDAVRLNLRITRDLAQRVMEFQLPDDADPAPVFQA
jgi:1-carboxybiuret hydrolase subunit AtzG-like